MAVSADIKFDQGPNSDIAGRAVVGTTTDGLVTVSNGNDTGVVNWTFQVLYVPPGSAVGLTTQGPSAVPTFTFTPDVAGTYRIQLTVVGAIATDTDIDIRCFSVAFPNGVIAPPYQRNPGPLPLTGAGGKADEMNFGGQPFGWDGIDSPAPILLFQVLKLVDAAITAGGEANLGANVGGSGEGVFRDKTGVTLNFKKLIAGSNITLTPAADTLTIATAGVGEVNTASNIGGGAEGVFKQKAGVNLEFHSLDAGANMTISLISDVLIFAAANPGETNTASNVGTGPAQGVFKQKAVADLEFHKLLSANANLTIALVGDDIVFTATGGGFPFYHFPAAKLTSSLTADWAVNGNAPLAEDSNNSGLSVRLADDTTEEGFGFEITVPTGAANMQIITLARAETAPGGAVVAKPLFYEREIADGAAVSAWSSSIALTDIDLAANEFFVKDTTSKTLAAWGIAVGQTHQIQITRTSASDTLTGDLAWNSVRVEFT